MRISPRVSQRLLLVGPLLGAMALTGGPAIAETAAPAPAGAPVSNTAPAAISRSVPLAPSGGTTISMPTAGSTIDMGAVSRNLVVETGEGRIMSLPGGAANIFVADPKVVEVRPASANSLFMFGVAAGRTTVAAMDGSGHPVAQFEVTVRPSAYAASEAASAVARSLPGSNIQVETTPKAVVLTGQVRDASTAERAETLVKNYLGQGQIVDNRLTLASSIQVGLRVRIVEMSRALTRELGINWQTLGTLGSFATTGGLTATTGLSNIALGTTDLNAVLDLLAQDNLTRTLAEPNLVTQSGETASFLAGGEYPIPVSGQNGSISVDYKQYGVQLSFIPTVLSDRKISLHVRPEVSEISTANSISLGTGSTGATSSAGISVPALTVRRADTTVELGSGQSFAVAGLLQDGVSHNVNALPFLGELPILGPLFRSDSFQRNETELVIVVTPYIVHPLSDPSALRTPSYTAPNDLDRLVRQHQLGQREALPPMRSSNNGFVVE